MEACTHFDVVCPWIDALVFNYSYMGKVDEEEDESPDWGVKTQRIPSSCTEVVR